jgi:hypothetical protein
VPQQALFLMNSPFITDQFQKVADLATKRASAGQARVKVLYQSLFQREPEPLELVDALKFIREAESADKQMAFTQLAQVLFLSNEFRFTD